MPNSALEHAPTTLAVHKSPTSHHTPPCTNTFLDNLITDFVNTPFDAMIERVRVQLANPRATVDRASTSTTPPPANTTADTSEKKKKQRRGQRKHFYRASMTGASMGLLVAAVRLLDGVHRA